MTLTEFLRARLDEDEAFWPIAVDTVEIIGRQYVNAQARADADIEAKRRIVATCGLIADDPTLPSTHLARHVLADLARPYADHPDYDEEWKP